MISSPSSIVLSCLGSAPVSQHLPFIMLEETELCLIVVTILIFLRSEIITTQRVAIITGYRQ